MIRTPSLILLASLLGGCASPGQNALLDDVLNRAMQETALSSADQGLAVKAVQVATQRRAADQGGGAPAEPAASAEPAGEAW